MLNLKKLGVALTLTGVLAVAAFGGEMPTPPCAPPVPGEMNTPPCSVMTEESHVPGETQTPPAMEAVDAIALTELALSMLLF